MTSAALPSLSPARSAFRVRFATAQPRQDRRETNPVGGHSGKRRRRRSSGGGSSLPSRPPASWESARLSSEESLSQQLPPVKVRLGLGCASRSAALGLLWRGKEREKARRRWGFCLPPRGLLLLRKVPAALAAKTRVFPKGGEEGRGGAREAPAPACEAAPASPPGSPLLQRAQRPAVPPLSSVAVPPPPRPSFFLCMHKLTPERWHPFAGWSGEKFIGGAGTRASLLPAWRWEAGESFNWPLDLAALASAAACSVPRSASFRGFA